MKRRDGLLVVSLAYLLLPNLIFILGWVRPLWALPSLLFIAIGIWRGFSGQLLEGPEPFSWKQALPLILLAFAFCILSGIGEISLQQSDYKKHNLVFFDLITRSFPVVYENPRYGSPFFCYYLAYYLPPSVFAKAFGGLEWAWLWNLLWSWAGLSLAFCWVARLASPGWLVVGIIMLAGGLDVVVRWVWLLEYQLGAKISQYFTEFVFNKAVGFKFYSPPHILFSDNLIEHRLEVPAPFSQLQWAPQHAIGGWLTTGILIYQIQVKRTLAWLPTLGICCLLWSPFVAVGLLPFALYGLTRAPLRTLFQGADWLVSLPIFVVIGSYFLAHYPQQYAGFLPFHLHTVSDWLLFVTFVLCHIGLLSGLLFLLHRRVGMLSPYQNLIAVALLTILAAFLIHMGKYNDFLMRAIIPAEWISLTFVLQALLKFWPRRSRKILFLLTALLLYLAVGMYYPVRQIGISIWRTVDPVKNPKVRGNIKTGNLYYGSDMSRTEIDFDHPEADLPQQYLGRRDSFFSRFLMKTPTQSTVNR